MDRKIKKTSEAKFRGLTLDDNTLITGSIIFSNGKTYIATTTDADIVIREVNPDSIAEFIGRVDSYETEIYSDDICIESHRAFDPCLFEWRYGVVERAYKYAIPDQYYPYRETDYGMGFFPYNITKLDIDLLHDLDKITGKDASIIKELGIATTAYNIKYPQYNDSKVVQFIYLQVIKDREKALKYMKEKAISRIREENKDEKKR